MPNLPRAETSTDLAPPSSPPPLKRLGTLNSILRRNTAGSSASRNNEQLRLANSIHYPPAWPEPDGIFDAVRRLIHGYDLVCHMLVDTELSKKPFVFRAFRRRLVLPSTTLELYNELQTAISDIEKMLLCPPRYHVAWKTRESSGLRMNGELESAQDSLQYFAERFYSKILIPIKLAMLQKNWFRDHNQFLSQFREDYVGVMEACETVRKGLNQVVDDAKSREAGDASGPNKRQKMPETACA